MTLALIIYLISFCFAWIMVRNMNKSTDMPFDRRDILLVLLPGMNTMIIFFAILALSVSSKWWLRDANKFFLTHLQLPWDEKIMKVDK